MFFTPVAGAVGLAAGTKTLDHRGANGLGGESEGTQEGASALPQRQRGLAAEGVNFSHNKKSRCPASKKNLLKTQMSSNPNSDRGFIQTLRNPWSSTGRTVVALSGDSFWCRSHQCFIAGGVRLVEMKPAFFELRHFIRVQDHVKPDIQSVMLAIKHPEWFDPSRFHQEKNVRPVHQRKGIRAEMMSFQDLVEKRRVGDPAVGHQKKGKFLR
jgi:hypothetical protein